HAVGEEALAVVQGPPHGVVLVYGEVRVEARVVGRVPVEVPEAPLPVYRPVVMAVYVLSPVRVADCRVAVQRVVLVGGRDVAGVLALNQITVGVVDVARRPLAVA